MKRALLEASLAAHTRAQGLKANFDELVASSEGSPPDDEHDPEGATIGFERAQISALLEQAEQDMEAVAKALDRIADGTFGTCVVCRRSIPIERLSARPSTPTCVDCAALS